MSETLANALQIEYTPKNDVVPMEPPPNSITNVDDDFDKIRDTLIDAIDQAKEAATEIRKLAKETQSPKMYEEFTRMLSTTIAAANSLASSHRAKKSIDAVSNKFDGKNGLNIFGSDVKIIGTTDEIVKRLRDGKGE